MSFDWNEYFLLAKELAGDSGLSSNKEARMRSAISRAYYSVLIQARDKASELAGKTYPTVSKGTFQWTIKTLFNYAKADNNQAAKEVGEGLKRLKINRERADYGDHIENLKSELESTMIETERLIGIVRELR